MAEPPAAPPVPVALPGAAPARPVRVALPGTVAADRAALLVAGDERPFALVGRWAGAAALAGSAPVRVAAAAEDPFAVLDAQPRVAGAPAGFVGGGWFGILGYGLGRRLEVLGPPPPLRESLPAAALAFYDHLLRLDVEGRWWFEALWTDERADALEARLSLLRARLTGGVAAPAPVGGSVWRSEPTTAGHARAVQACRTRIAAGDLFQANLALRLRAAFDGDPVHLFTKGVAALRPDRAAFVGCPEGAVASLSPELFVARDGDDLLSAPIKGTRPMPAEPAAAAAQRSALAESAKDRAENVMIVDLVRNDLGRVCEPGSVRVAALAEPRAHTGVWHLVSEVVGRRRAGIGDGDLVRALFPPGSVTGAPKLAAMDVVSELESAARQTFCGAIGFAGPVAGLELSVAIRTFECRDGNAWLDVGGGVVADSDPQGEAAECLAKARPLLAAIGGRIDEGAGGGAPPPRRLGPRPVPRPDPRGGVFETLLVRDGTAVAAERHLARLAHSARTLHRRTLPDGLDARVRRAALERHGACRLRVVLDAGGEVRLELTPLVAEPEPVVLDPVAVPGGLGAHKWSDRRLVDALEQAVTPASPLLVDLDGRVLETTRASVFAAFGGRLFTPPADGRILPGVGRAQLLETGAIERPLVVADLNAADAVYVVSALRGTRAVAALSGSPRLRSRAR